MIYIFLRAKYILARSLHRVKEYKRAEEICDFIIKAKNNEIRKDPSEYWKYAVKAAYIKAKQMQNCMEFAKSKEILEEEAKPILKELTTHFHKGETDESKELQDTPYNFQYRKKYASYLRKFAFYTSAFTQLQGVLADEAKYYGLTVENGDKSENEVVDVLSTFKMDNLANYMKDEKNVLNPRQGIPHLKIKDTIYQMSKSLSLQLKTDDCLAYIKKCEDILTQVYGTEILLQVAQLYNSAKEALLKSSTPRNKINLDRAMEYVEQT